MVDSVIVQIARWATNTILFLLMMMQLMTVLRIVDNPLSIIWRNISLRESFAKVRLEMISLGFLVSSLMYVLAFAGTLNCF